MQTITTLDQAADTIRTEFPEAHVNVISDTGIEVYMGEPEDCYFIEEVSDEETGDTTGWDGREGWGDAIYPGTIHRAEVGTSFDSLAEAVERAISHLRSTEH